METFLFPYHTVTHVYPKGESFKFGRGYEFSAAPQLPVQRRFTLHFDTMVWFANAAGAADANIQPELNMLRLVQFYERHYTHKAFVYPHPVFGNLKVKFASDAPFELPKTKLGGGGSTEEFTLLLVEQG